MGLGDVNITFFSLISISFSIWGLGVGAFSLAVRPFVVHYQERIPVYVLIRTE